MAASPHAIIVRRVLILDSMASNFASILVFLGLDCGSDVAADHVAQALYRIIEVLGVQVGTGEDVQDGQAVRIGRCRLSARR